MFCTHIKNTHDLDSELEGLLNFIDGEIISYDITEGSRGFMSTSQERTEVMELLGDISNIKTDKGRTYNISFNAYQVYARDEDFIGITKISIVDRDTYTEESGYSEDGVVVIGETIYNESVPGE